MLAMKLARNNMFTVFVAILAGLILAYLDTGDSSSPKTSHVFLFLLLYVVGYCSFMAGYKAGWHVLNAHNKKWKSFVALSTRYADPVGRLFLLSALFIISMDLFGDNALLKPASPITYLIIPAVMVFVGVCGIYLTSFWFGWPRDNE